MSTPEPDEHLLPYVPRVAARWLRDTPSARHQAVDGTLVSADISGFTALSEALAGRGRVGAEAVVAVVNSCFEEMIEAAADHGGDVLKFGGDALLILFDGEDHAARAAVASAALRRIVLTPREHELAGAVPLSVSIGLHSGTFHLFLLRAGHGELIIAGPDASRTVACESAAEAGQLLASTELAALLPDAWRNPTPAPEGTVVLDPPTDREPWIVDREMIEGIEARLLVPPAILDHIGQREVQGQIRPATTAFLGFSGLDEAIETAGPRRVARTLQRMVEVVDQATQSYGVTWLDTDIAPDGGKIHLTAGAPTSTNDDDAAMLHAVRAILDACVDPPLQAGVNHGTVFCGDVGGTSRRTLAAMGDSVNVAARLCGKAEVGQLVAARGVLEESGTRFDHDELAPIAAKGKAEPILAVSVGQPSVDPTPASTEVDDDGLPLVGRDAEVTLARECLRRGIVEEASALVVTGVHGIGKTRLVREACVTIDATARVLQVSCIEHQAGTPYAAFGQLLRAVLALPPDADAAAAGAALIDHIARVDPALAPWAPLIATPLGAVVAPTPEADRVAAAFRPLRVQQTTGDFIRAALAEPTVIVIDDCQWLDETSRELLDEVLLGLFDVPWCVVLSSTDPLEPDTDADVTVIAPPELTPDAARELARTALADRPITDRVLDGIVEAAAGNPLFLLELVEQQVETGNLDLMPRTVEAAVTSRFDQLPPEDLARVRELSVLGTEVPRRLASVILGPAVDDDALWEATGAFVEVTDDRLRFRKAIYQQIAYEGLSFARRRELHATAADRLHEDPRPDDAPWLAWLAKHEDRAGRHDAAWRACRDAGRAMQELWAPAEAAEQYRRALANAEHVAEIPGHEVAAVAESLGDVAEIASLYDDAIAAYEQALTLSQRRADRARLLHRMARVDLNLGETDRAVQRLTEAMALVEDDERDLAGIERASIAEEFGRIRFRQGRFDEALDWTRRALDEVGRENPHIRARALFIQASCRMQQNDTRAAAGLALALDLFEQSGDLVHQGHCHTNLGLIAYYRGDWDNAASHYRVAHDHYHQAGYQLGAAMQDLNFGEIQLRQRNWAEARRSYADAHQRYRAMKAPLGAAVADGHLGYLDAKDGRHDEGLARLRQASEVLDGLGATDHALAVRSQLAEVLVQQDLLDEAADVLDTALGQDPEQTIASALWRIRGSLLARQGRGDEAREALQRALDIARAGRLRYDEAITMLDLSTHDDAHAARASDLADTARRTLSGLGVRGDF